MNTDNSRKNCKKMLSKLNRRGSIAMLAALVLVMVFGFLSFTADIGYIALTKGQMQTAADAAMLAAGQDLPQGWGDYASVGSTNIAAIARQSAIDVAASNQAGGLDSVYVNGSRDVRLGQRTWDSLSQSWVATWGVPPYNTVEVTIHRDVAGTGSDGPLPLFFAPIIGHETADLSVTASAMLTPAVGFRIENGSSQTAAVLPITLDRDTWYAMLAQQTGQDNFSYNSATGVISLGSDGIFEIDLYPSDDAQLPSGNRGTVDFGSSNNSTADLSRQIVDGLNDDDLSYFGGEIRFDQGPWDVNGDTGISAGIKDELESIKGQPRAIPLFVEVSAPGNNAMFTVVEFVGIRIMDVNLTGGEKHVYIQPAPFTDPTAIHGDPKTFSTTTTLMAPAVLIQ